MATYDSVPHERQCRSVLGVRRQGTAPVDREKVSTSELRMLAGHSAGGKFPLHAIRLKPDLFQAVMVASPWLARDDRKELNQLLPFVSSRQLRLRTLFVTWADEGAEMRADVDALTTALTSRTDASLRWRSAHYPDETHDSTGIKSYYDGLRMIFAGYNYPRDPKTNLLAGSLDDVKSHFAKLGEHLGVPLGPPERLVNELGYQYLHTGPVRTGRRRVAVQYGAAPAIGKRMGQPGRRARASRRSHRGACSLSKGSRSGGGATAPKRGGISQASLAPRSVKKREPERERNDGSALP